MMDHNSDTVRVVLHTRHVIDDPSRVGLVAIGSTKPLGCWQEEDAVEADYIGFSTWQLVIRLPKYQTTYWKWAIMDRHSRQVIHWETRDNRVLEIDNLPLMVTSTWNDDDTVVPIDSSVSETLRERAAEALAEYMACQEKGKNRNALEINQHVCDHHYGFDMNTNAGEYLLPSGDSRLSVTRLANSLASKIPVKSKHPSCKGDEVLHNIHKSPDHVKRSYEKPKYKWKKKPIKLLDEACKSQASLDTIDTVLNGLKPETKGNISKIPVKVKYNKCCNCKFNDIMYSLKSSMKSLQDIEDKRTSNLKYSLQDQIPTITDESACLINLDSFEKSLTQELPERSPERSPTQQLELSRGSPEKSLTQQLSTGSPERSPTHQLELSTGSPSRDHDREEDLSFTLPSLDYNREDSYILPPTTKVNRQALEYTKTEVARTVYELPRRTSSWLPGLFSQLMSNLIVALLVVLICKVFLQQFQCPSIVQSECMFSLW